MKGERPRGLWVTRPVISHGAAGPHSEAGTAASPLLIVLFPTLVLPGSSGRSFICTQERNISNRDARGPAQLAGSWEDVANGMDLTETMTIMTCTGSGEVQAIRVFTANRKNSGIYQ